MLLFSVKALRDAFEITKLPKLEEECARLFRSNAFNITERRLNLEERVRLYPQLKDLETKNPTDKELANHLL